MVLQQPVELYTKASSLLCAAVCLLQAFDMMQILPQLLSALILLCFCVLRDRVVTWPLVFTATAGEMQRLFTGVNIFENGII